MINIDSTRTLPALKMPWKKAIAVGRGYELLRQDLLDHLDYLQEEIGYQYTRFHAIFHDDMNVYGEDTDGNPIYQWHHVDKILDATQKLGLKHILELNPMPSALASGDQTMFHFNMNVTPPKCYKKWENLVKAFIEHVVERYGREAILDWYFEVWNEPNLPGFWSGTQEEYFKLYEASVNAVKAVDPRFRIGGPASSKCAWIGEMIEHCAKHDIPLDFISSHLYPQDEYVEYANREGSPHDYGMFFIDTVKAAKTTIRNSALPQLPFLFTEWNTMSCDKGRKISWTHNPDVDTLYGASMALHLCYHLDDVLDILTWWVASDIFEEGGIPSEPFSSTYGLLTVRGTPKATCNAFRLLSRMQGDRLALTLNNKPNLANGIATINEGQIRILLWNHIPHEVEAIPWKDNIVIQLPDTLRNAPSLQILTASIQKGKGSAYESWRKMGSPLNPTPLQECILTAHSEPAYDLQQTSVKGSTVEIPVQLNPWEVTYFEITPPQKAVTKLPIGESLAHWDKLMGDLSR